ncbi:MAG TPA: alpha/beta hydrolase [Polyangiaceae bacterium]|jgi:pimeloyl-ACP methyl ester carboxylesterase|nr:alpha/beta hydrolase [Polyangiaceae bacterium]
MSSQTVLLVHSGGFTSRQWRKLAADLAPTYQVLAPDLLGYGASGPWPLGERFHFRQDVAHLESILNDAKAPVHVVGHSYGGFLALKLALDRPNAVRSLALFEPVAFGILNEPADTEARRILDLLPTRYAPGSDGVVDRWLAGFVDWWNGPGAWASLAEDAKGNFRAVGWKLSQEVATLVTDQTDRGAYRSLAMPALLLGGAQSPLPARRVLEKLAAALPRATLQIFEDMGHMAPITHADVVNAAIVAHIDACSTKVR